MTKGQKGQGFSKAESC